MHHPPNNHDADAGVHSNVSNFPSQITDHHHRYYANQAMKVVSSFHSGKHDSNGSGTNASNNNSTAATASFSSNSSSNDSRGNISNSNMEYGRSSFRVRAILSPNGNNVECVDYDANKNNDGRSSTTSSSTSYSSSASASHRDHRHSDHHHHVTFRDEKKRVPKSVNATTLLVSLSKSSSTLSREEYVVGGSSFGGGPAIINHHHHHGGGDDNSKNSVTSSYGYSASDNESSHTSMSNFDLVSNPVNFTVCHSNEQDTYNNHDNNNIANHNLATSSMFTKEDLDAITPLQISTYLTLKQRETIGTKVLCAKLKKRRYSVIDGGRTVCRVCCMPRLGRWSGEKSKSSSSSSSSNELEAIECPICPVLKKRVLEKILDGCM